MDIATLKQFLGIEHDEDDTLLSVLVKRSEIYVENQVGSINKSNVKMKEQYEQACALLVQHWYDNRESFRIGNNSYEIPYSLDSIVRQLKYCYTGDDST